MDKRLTDNAMGFQGGANKGYPALLLDLLHKNNKTNDYAFMNYAIKEGGLMQFEDQNILFQDDCRAEQLNKSLPNFVVMNFGASDNVLPNFSEEEYIKLYTNQIKQIQDLPSKPMVFLIVPVYTRQTIDAGKEIITNVNDPYFPAFAEVPLETRLDLQRSIYQIANNTGIPHQHVVNAWYMLRLNQ